MVAASLPHQSQFQSESQPESQSHVSLFSPQELGQQELPPSERDFQVFESLVIGGASTRQAAGEFGVSQTRVVQIRQRVAQWMGAEVPPTPRLAPLQRLRLAAEIAERRADFLYSQAMDGWRASQLPQTSVGRGRLGEELRTTRERHGDCRYLLAAMRISERQMHLSGTIRKVLADALERESGIGSREENSSRFPVPGSKLGEQDAAEGDSVARNPPVRACSLDEPFLETGHVADSRSARVSDCQDDVYDDLENRRQAFLAALQDDPAPVQPPFTDANGMLLADESTECEGTDFLPLATGAESPSGSAAVANRPLNRKERRARQRMLERKLRKAK